jgi:conjugative transfer signal peptidase TraF
MIWTTLSRWRDSRRSGPGNARADRPVVSPRWVRVGRALGVTLLGLLGTVALGFGLGLRINMTSSVPEGLYWMVYRSAAAELHLRAVDDVRHLDLVVVCLPPAIAEFGRRRRYLPAGSCSTGVMPVEKVVVGVPGDVVRTDGRRLVIAGHELPRCGRALRVDPQGAPMRAAIGEYRLEGAVWLCGLTSDSWDSRYYGPVPLAAVQGRAYPVIVGWPEGSRGRLLESWADVLSQKR